MAGHLVAFAAFFMQSEPPAFAMLEVVAIFMMPRAPTRAKLEIMVPISVRSNQSSTFS
jgi:hypothetical protein